MSKSYLSSRGLPATESSPRVDLEVYFEALQNLYHPLKNPHGALPLNMAENRHCWNILNTKMEEILRTQSIPDWVAGYTSALGHPSVRESIARFMETFLTGCPIDPNRLVMSAGASSVIEMSALILAEKGDVVVFPAPSYPVYKLDIGAIAGLERFNLVTHHEVSELVDGPRVDQDLLEETFQGLKKAGKNFAMLVITNPDNPTGMIYSEVQLEKITQWCLSHEVHLVVNEIYALSLIDTTQERIAHLYPADTPMTSFASIIKRYDSPLLHMWYAFSKDFGISGFRVGLLHTKNESFLKAYANLNLGHMVSNLTQWLLGEVLADDLFVRDYLAINKTRLTESYAIVATKMEELGIPFVAARGSLFVWIDLSKYLESPEQKAEDSFWIELYKQTGILLTPGNGFGHSKKGQFRVVHTFLELGALKVAMERLGEYLSQLDSSLKLQMLD
jgi:aspartate/methionine/tyrosine aminotransferase